MATQQPIWADVAPLVALYSGMSGACRSTGSNGPDFANLRERLHRGLFPAALCRPWSVSDVGPIEWWRVERVEAPVEDVRSPLADALSAVCRFEPAADSRPSPVIVVVDDGSPGKPGVRHIGGLYLGVTPSKEGLGIGPWLAGVLAPGTLLVPHTEPAGLRHVSTYANGITYAQTPGRPEETDREGIPALARLLLSPPAGWCVALRLDPVGYAATRRLENSLSELTMALARFGTVSDSTTAERSITIEQPEAAALRDTVAGMLAHVQAGEAVGLWQASLYVGADDLNTLETMTGATASLLSQDRLTGNRWIAHRVQAEDLHRPGSRNLPIAGSVLSTSDVAQFLATGESSVPGLEVLPAMPAGRRPMPADQPLPLGTFMGTGIEFSIDLQDLEGHAFVTGTTGMGKSTTVQRLLMDLWNRHKVPFLIIDPVKADYAELAPSIRKGLQLLDAADLALNVLEPYPGFSIRTHLELVANAFKGSFSMPSPVPYIVAQLFERMIDRSRTPPPPTLHDIRDLLDSYVASLGYDGEIESNIRASLGLRLSLLLSPSKAERMASPANSMLDSILKRPTVVELSSLGDDEERAFLMSILTLYVAEHARGRGRSGGKVRHVTVLEEAHRVLPEPREGGSIEEGDAASVSARLLTQLLAEIRSYGESMIVVDQSPAAVARDVVRNTNLKIAHRLPDPEDRDVVGGSIGLTDEQLPSLSRLRRGEVLLATRRTGEAEAVSITRPPTASGRGPVSVESDTATSDRRACCNGARAPLHHAAESNAREAESAAALALNMLMWGAADRDATRASVTRELDIIIESDASLLSDPAQAQDCLLWVGLRRALLRHVAYDHLAADQVEARLSQALAMWQRRRLGRIVLRTPPAQSKPFYGCQWCTAVCRYRHVGEVSLTAGRPDARQALLPRWSPGSAFDSLAKLQTWWHATRLRLTPALGEEPADDLARCAVTQLAAGLDMPLASQTRLLLRPYEA